MIKNLVIYSSLIIFTLIYNGCKPSSGPSEDPIYKELTTLTKTPDQVIPWISSDVDSLWIIYSDRTWESIKVQGNSKRNFDLGIIGTARFSAWANDGVNTYIGSSAGIFFQFIPLSKTYSKTVLRNDISQPVDYTNYLHASNDSTFIVMKHQVYKWNGNQFKLLTSLPTQRIRDFIKIDNNYFWLSQLPENFDNYQLNKSNLSITKTDVFLPEGRNKLTFISSNGLNYGIISNETGTLITGFVYPGSTSINHVSLEINQLKEYKGSAIGISDGLLVKLDISPSDGSITSKILIKKSEIGNKNIQNYWIYSNNYYLLLENNKLVTVKL